MQQIEANWMVLGAIALVVLLVAWWMLKSRKPQRREYKPDVLDEGVGPAQRNQALIDAPPVAVVPVTPAAVVLGGISEVIEHAAEEALERAEAQAPEPEAEAIAQTLAAAHADTGAADDLLLIKGVGPKLKTILADLGVTSFAQIAAWSEEDMARIDSQLGAFAGRPARDNWIEQARLLSSGDTSAYEAKFGKL